VLFFMTHMHALADGQPQNNVRLCVWRYAYRFGAGMNDSEAQSAQFCKLKSPKNTPRCVQQF